MICCWPLATESNRNGWPRIPSDDLPKRAGLAQDGSRQQPPPPPLSLGLLLPLLGQRKESNLSLLYLFNKRKHNHSLTHYFWWMHRKNILYIRKGVRRSRGQAKGKQIGCLQRSSVRRQRNRVPSDSVGKPIATGAQRVKRDRWGGLQPLPQRRRQNK